jgi:hypothetical protein
MTSALNPSMIGSDPMASRKPPIVPVFERLGQGVNVDTQGYSLFEDAEPSEEFTNVRSIAAKSSGNVGHPYGP